MLEMGARCIKKVTLELGGKSANIVLDDADMDMAVDGALFASFFHSGQVCESGTRLFLPEALYEDFLARMAERARGIRIGHQLDPEDARWARWSARSSSRASSDYVEIGRKEGARLVCGGERAKVAGLRGRLLPRADDLRRRGQQLAHRAGGDLRAGALRHPVQDRRRRHRDRQRQHLRPRRRRVVARRASAPRAVARAGPHRHRCGSTTTTCSATTAPFGGYKQSGIGRELGHWGLEEYTELKHVHIGSEGDPDASAARSCSSAGSARSATSSGPPPGSSPARAAWRGSPRSWRSSAKKRILLVTDAGVVKAGLVERVKDALGSRLAAIFAEVPQDSGLEVIDAAAALRARSRAWTRW